MNGRWLKGPGKRFFKALEEEFGELPFMAEDLGYLTAEVRNLKSISGLPGMRIYQFEASPDLGDERLDELLRAEGRDIAYYSGTHDNDTLLGWYSEQRHTGDLSAQEKKELVEQALERIYLSGANWVIIPLQDILGMDSAARMNTPGTKKGNWAWRMKNGDLTRERAEWLRLMAVRSGRAGD